MTPAATTMEGKLCVVTGATSGIGKGTCLGLARLGATVVMVSRNAERGELVRAELAAASGSSKISVELADMADQRAVRALAAAAERHGRRDLHLLPRVEHVGVDHLLGRQRVLAAERIGQRGEQHRLVEVRLHVEDEVGDQRQLRGRLGRHRALL